MLARSRFHGLTWRQGGTRFILRGGATPSVRYYFRPAKPGEGIAAVVPELLMLLVLLQRICREGQVLLVPRRQLPSPSGVE